MPIKIAVAIPKGGVGKTTTAVNLAASLVEYNRKVLLVDLDAAGACSSSLGIDVETIENDILDLLSFSKPMEKVVHKTSIEGLDLIPQKSLDYEEEFRLSNITKNVLLLRNLLSQSILKYDYFVIDCPPYLRGFTTSALAAADSIILPVKVGGFSLKALSKMFRHIDWIKTRYNGNLTIQGILPTMVERRSRIWQISERRLFRAYGNNMFYTTIPKSTAFAESAFMGKTIGQFDSGSKGANAYRLLAREVIARNKTCPAIEEINKYVEKNIDNTGSTPAVDGF
jgi:chromosome partitioning protein